MSSRVARMAALRCSRCPDGERRPPPRRPAVRLRHELGAGRPPVLGRRPARWRRSSPRGWTPAAPRRGRWPPLTGASLYVVQPGLERHLAVRVAGDGTLTPLSRRRWGPARRRSASPWPPTAPRLRRRQGDNAICVYDVAADGALAEASSRAAETTPVQVALSPDGERVRHELRSASVSQYDVAADGALSPKTPASVPAGPDPGRAWRCAPTAQRLRGQPGRRRHRRAVLVAADGTLSPLTPRSSPPARCRRASSPAPTASTWPTRRQHDLAVRRRPGRGAQGQAGRSGRQRGEAVRPRAGPRRPQPVRRRLRRRRRRPVRRRQRRRAERQDPADRRRRRSAHRRGRGQAARRPGADRRSAHAGPRRRHRLRTPAEGAQYALERSPPTTRAPTRAARAWRRARRRGRRRPAEHRDAGRQRVHRRRSRRRGQRDHRDAPLHRRRGAGRAGADRRSGHAVAGCAVRRGRRRARAVLVRRRGRLGAGIVHRRRARRRPAEHRDAGRL